ncbi:BEN domain-containing protein 6 [Varanus komodoensis]|nr:BEN domain-containing protein 6 [Varanus komodoensis]
MATKLYVLISWPDGSRVINMENIKEPRKPFHQYEVGEQVLTRCPGFSGLYWGTVEGISEHKGLLEKRLQKDKELLIRGKFGHVLKGPGEEEAQGDMLVIYSCDESKSTSSLEMDGFEVVQKAFEMEREDKIEQLQQMVFDLQREVLSLKQKVQHLEATSLKEEGPICQQPCKESERFNGYTREQLKEAIRFDQKISTACKTLLYKLFTSEYIQNHSITGRRGNTFREAKPMMDERCIKIIRVLLKQKFGDHLSDTVITEKIQNVQKALRQKCKMECL